jgi:hypothetical protein
MDDRPPGILFIGIGCRGIAARSKSGTVWTRNQASPQTVEIN